MDHVFRQKVDELVSGDQPDILVQKAHEASHIFYRHGPGVHVDDGVAVNGIWIFREGIDGGGLGEGGKIQQLLSAFGIGNGRAEQQKDAAQSDDESREKRLHSQEHTAYSL